MLEEELMHEYKYIGECFTRIKTKVGASINSEENLNGCLQGRIEDYVPIDFGTMLTEVKARFAENHECWDLQASGDVDSLNDRASEIKSRCTGIQSSLKGLFVLPKIEPKPKV